VQATLALACVGGVKFQMKPNLNLFYTTFFISLSLIIIGGSGLFIGAFKGLSAPHEIFYILKTFGFIAVAGGIIPAAAILDSPSPDKLVSSSFSGASITLAIGFFVVAFAFVYIGQVINLASISALILGVGLFLMGVLNHVYLWQRKEI